MARFDAWMDWPHVRAPPTPATIELVKLAVQTLPSVLEELKKLEFPIQACWTMRICTALLQHRVLTHGLSLRAIALLMTRQDPAEPSWLERRVEFACREAGVAADFVSEGKYGDLVLHVDRKVMSQFENLTPGCETKHFKTFEHNFFDSLIGEYSNPTTLRTAHEIEAAEQRPWD